MRFSKLINFTVLRVILTQYKGFGGIGTCGFGVQISIKFQQNKGLAFKFAQIFGVQEILTNFQKFVSDRRFTYPITPRDANPKFTKKN